MSIISPICGTKRSYSKKRIGSDKSPKSNSDDLYKQFMALDNLLNQITNSRSDYERKGMQYEAYKMKDWEDETMKEMEKLWSKMPKYLKEKIDRGR
jgi:hypothetical protein